MATCSKCSTFYVTATNCPKDGAALLDDDTARRQGIVPVAAERYALQSMLGEGGMGTVYLAIHRELGRKVAIKILRKEGQNSQSIERFKREAQASSVINHRNVVSILDFGELPDQSLFIVMEHLEGKSLADAIDNEGPFSVERTLTISIQIARGLAAAHDKKVIHRDLKPDNIFLLDNQEFPDFVKLLDFGIAKMLGGERLTKTGMVLGTPDYMSPEQATGQPADLRADIYAMGILMYEMLVGQRPFMGESFIQVLSQHLHAKPPLVANQRTDIDVPEGCDEIIQICLAKQPDQRYQSMEQIAQALYNLPGALSVLPEPLLPPGAGRRKSPPGLRLPNTSLRSNTAPPKISPVPSFSGRPNSSSGLSRSVPVSSLASTNRSNAISSSKKTPDREIPADRDQQTMITEEPTIPPPRPRPPSVMIEEDQPTSAWTEDPAENTNGWEDPPATRVRAVEDSVETLPPEVGKALAKLAASGAYETWHGDGPNKVENIRATLTDGDLDNLKLKVGNLLQQNNDAETMTQSSTTPPRLSPAYGNRALNYKTDAPSEPKKVVVHSGKDPTGKVVIPAPASNNARGGPAPTLLDGQLNKKDIVAQEDDALSTAIAPNPMAPTSVVTNPLLVSKEDHDDESTASPNKAPAVFNRKGEMRIAPVSVDIRSEEVLDEPTRSSARLPQPSPTAPEGTPTSIITNFNNASTSEFNPDEDSTSDQDSSSQDAASQDASSVEQPTAEQTSLKTNPIKAGPTDLEGTEEEEQEAEAEEAEEVEEEEEEEDYEQEPTMRPGKYKDDDSDSLDHRLTLRPDEPEDPLDVQSTLKPDLAAKAAAKQREKIEQMARIAQSAKPAVVEAKPTTPSKRKPLLIGALVLMLVLLVFSGVYWLLLH